MLTGYRLFNHTFFESGMKRVFIFIIVEGAASFEESVFMHKLNLNQHWRVLTWVENVLVGGTLTMAAGVLFYLMF